MNPYKFHFWKCIAKTNELFNDILIYWDAFVGTCFGLADVHEPNQTTELKVEYISQCGIMWYLHLTGLPLLFVLITERFTLLYWPISYCNCDHQLLVAVLNCACTLEPSSTHCGHCICYCYVPPCYLHVQIHKSCHTLIYFGCVNAFIVTFSLCCSCCSLISYKRKRRWKSEIRSSNQSELSC